MTTPVSLTIPQFDEDPGPVFDLCARAADLGLTGLFAFDHLIPIKNPNRPVLEATSTLGAIAASAPPPVRVGSLVLRVTLRPPSVTADIARTVAALVGSRAVIGLGVGDRFSAEEAIRFGFPPRNLDERLALLSETVKAVRQEAESSEIWVGGTHPRLRNLAAIEADGWNAWGISVADMVPMVAEVREASTRPLCVSWGGGVVLAPDQRQLKEALLRRSGGSALPGAPLISGTPSQVVEELSLRSSLVDELVLSVLPNRPATWELFAAEVLPNLG
ncbi:MAG TPA: LLM class flavin-dependent oxidoreductase [Acidimicrobiia bacterium]|nr:LLM class flavin-dependent oxidoreductase [Acidimicrobiia bacterium]